jgi:adenylate cyclase class 2
MTKNNIETEGRILNIDVADVRSKILQAGGKKVKDFDFKRYVFDVIPVKDTTWVRLRSDGEKTTLTVKEVVSEGIDGTNEWEVEVSDVDNTLMILEKIGIKPRGYQENKRELYDLDGVEVSIDYWPMLEPYLEIEASSADKIIAIAGKLGFKNSDVIGDSVAKIYADNGIDIIGVKELKFED